MISNMTEIIKEKLSKELWFGQKRYYNFNADFIYDVKLSYYSNFHHSQIIICDCNNIIARIPLKLGSHVETYTFSTPKQLVKPTYYSVTVTCISIGSITFTEKKRTIEDKKVDIVVDKLKKNTELLQDSKQDIITFLIRTHNRTNYLKRAINSISYQTDTKYNIVIISDYSEDYNEILNIKDEFKSLKIMIKTINKSIGYPQCNSYFNMVKDIVNSYYVGFIDDDDEIVDNEYVATIRNIIKNNGLVSIIMSRCQINNYGVVPEDEYWKKPPTIRHISGLNFAIQYNTFMTNEWKPIKRGDFYYINKIYSENKDIYWYNKITHLSRNGENRGKEGNKIV